MADELVEQVVVEPPAPPAVDIASLQSQLTKLEVELEQTKKGLSTAHQTLTQKDRELKSQADLRAEIKGIREDMELLAVGLATKDEVEPTDGTSRQNVLAELQKRRAASEAKLRADAEALARQEYNQRADAIYAQAKTLFGEGQEEKLEDIEDLLKSGNIVRAEQRLSRASKTTVAKDEPPKESEEDRVTRLVKEQLARDYPNMYTSDAGLPGGSASTSWGEIERQYAAGEITTEAYSQARKKQGIL